MSKTYIFSCSSNSVGKAQQATSSTPFSCVSRLHSFPLLVGFTAPECCALTPPGAQPSNVRHIGRVDHTPPDCCCSTVAAAAIRRAVVGLDHGHAIRETCTRQAVGAAHVLLWYRPAGRFPPRRASTPPCSTSRFEPPCSRWRPVCFYESSASLVCLLSGVGG